MTFVQEGSPARPLAAVTGDVGVVAGALTALVGPGHQQLPLLTGAVHDVQAELTRAVAVAVDGDHAEARAIGARQAQALRAIAELVVELDPAPAQPERLARGLLSAARFLEAAVEA